MSFLDKLIKETRRSMDKIGRASRSRSVEDVVISLVRNMRTETIEDLAYPITIAAADEIDRCTVREEEDLLIRYGNLLAETIILTALEKERLDDSLPLREFDNFKDSRRKWETLMEDAKEMEDRGRGSSRRRDHDDRGRGSSRRRDHDDRDKGRHSNSFERDGDDDDREDRRSSRDSDREERIERKEEVIESLADGATITSENYALLPTVARDVPFYFAGVEELVFSAERNKVIVAVLDGAFKMNYDKHRTDIWLAPNRAAQNIPLKVEDLETRMKKAAEERVNAFIKKEKAEGQNTGPEFEFAKFKIEKDILIDGIYSSFLPPVGAEREFREQTAELIESPLFNEQLVAISCLHCVDDLENIDRTGDDYLKFIDTLAAMSMEPKLVDIKTALELAASLFDAPTYDVIHTMFNDAVCNALSASLKLGIKTTNVLDAWTSIEKLVEETAAEQPNIVPIIQMNLCAALPTMFESPTLGLAVYRNYIFLPMAKSDLSIASPVRYATLYKSNREEMYNLINKLLTTNVPAETYKPYTTLVTTDNYTVPLFKNRGLVHDAGYYVFNPIR